MEGPSLVIAKEELAPFRRKEILKVSATDKSLERKLRGARFIGAESWGKHLILRFSTVNLRIHFLLFGSYRIDHPRPHRWPKLQLRFSDHQVFFYSCSIKELPRKWRPLYDWSTDLMSPKWDAKKALKQLIQKENTQVADALLDQSIFSGLGNIMKNEILFRLRIHPETQLGSLSKARLRALVKEAENYSGLFYAWKKKNELKRHWQIMRKKICPRCGGKVRKRPTGKLQRLSHFCPRCQAKVNSQ
jgi:endonuclease-8